ncbi:MAG: magnesium transporter [Bacteroidia bacterium]|jgi:magnesium transporter
MSKNKRNKKLFHSPITLNLQKEDGDMHMDCIVYSEEGYMRLNETRWRQVQEFIASNTGKTTWINLYPLENKKALEDIEEHFDINPFMMADAVDFSLRSKYWFTEKHLFCSFKMKKPNFDGAEHISFILGQDVLVSLQEVKEDVFEHIRIRIENNYGLIRKKGVDYLFFLLCDALIDQYTLISDESEETLLLLEENINANYKEVGLHNIHDAKKELLQTHKDVRAAGDVLDGITASDFFQLSDLVKKLFTSIGHNAKYSIDSFSRQLEHTKNLSDLHFAQQNNELNEMIKLLTIMSAIFIPITFIAGLYGMNFKNIPELQMPWGYPAIIGIMVLVVVFILYLFKRKKWL